MRPVHGRDHFEFIPPLLDTTLKGKTSAAGVRGSSSTASSAASSGETSSWMGAQLQPGSVCGAPRVHHAAHSQRSSRAVFTIHAITKPRGVTSTTREREPSPSSSRGLLAVSLRKEGGCIAKLYQARTTRHTKPSSAEARGVPAVAHGFSTEDADDVSPRLGAASGLGMN